MKQVVSRWAVVAGYDVYVDEHGHVNRGITPDGQRPLYPYRWDRQLKVWSRDKRMTPAAVRAGIRRGTVTMQ